MTFVGYKDVISYGDTVLLLLGGKRRNPILQFQVEQGKVHQTAYGALKHKDLVGKHFGSKVNCSKGWVYVLHPTPELWTISLPHRTQILYSTDISMVMLQLEVKPGSIVIEAGTGSGSLSHAFIRTVAPAGHLHTFDFHEHRAKVAEQEFKAHSVGELVTIRHRDVCRDGFELQDCADAVFLDLPSPWLAFTHAISAMKKTGGRLCSFSPCIEQVQKTCSTMHELGLSDIQTFECLQKPHEVRTVTMPLVDLGDGQGEGHWYRICRDPPVGRFTDPVTQNDVRGGDAARPPHVSDVSVEAVGSQNHSDSQGGEETVTSRTVEPADTESERSLAQNDDSPAKRRRCDNDAHTGANVIQHATSQTDSAEPEGDTVSSDAPPAPDNDVTGSQVPAGGFLFKTGEVPLEIPGHTGYLTFATVGPSTPEDTAQLVTSATGV